MRKIRIDGVIYTGPASWEELDRDGLLQYARVLSCKNMTDKQIKHQLAYRLMGIPYSLFKKLPEQEKVKAHESIQWIFEKNAITNWLLPVISVNGSQVFGPDDGLDDITGEEFMMCELEFESYLQDENANHAETIFAALYRKKRFFSSDRRRFDKKFMQKLERVAKNLSPALKEALLINYAGCRNLVIDLHPNIWKKAAATTDQEPGTGKTSWASLFMDISGDKFGDYPSTIRTNLWLLLKDMDKKAENADSVKSK